MRRVLLALAVASTLWTVGSAQETITLKFAHELQENTPQHTGALAFKRIVEEQSAGALRVKVFSAAQLGSEREVMEMIQVGAVESGMVTTAILGNIASEFQLVDLPFLFPSREAAYRVLDGEVGAEILRKLERNRLIGAAFWESGFKQFTSNVEIRNPDDIAGLKFRTMESPIIIDTYRELGANPVPISFPEVYTALQQKVVDGQENPIATITTMRFYEVQDYLTISNHAYLGYAVIFNKSWFNSLSEDLQGVLLDAARGAARIERQAVADKEEEFLAEIAQSDTVINELSQEQLRLFSEATQGVHRKYRDRIGEDLLEAAYNEVRSQ